MKQEFRPACGQSIEIGAARSGNCRDDGFCGTRDIEQLIINDSNKPIDTVVGYFLVTRDDVPYVMTSCNENISLDFSDICPVAVGDELVAFIGYFEWMCPADRRCTKIFTVREFVKWGQPKAKDTGMAQLYTF
jgi:hypothetical protein